MQPLQGTIAVVAGATRGAGRGIACMLGAAGATVYCTGRSTRTAARAIASAPPSPFALAYRPETIEDTAELVTQHGGQGIAVRVDHTIASEVEALFARIEAEQGRIDLLVNDVWGGDELTVWNTPFWQLNLADGFLMHERAVHSHIITSHYAVPLMLPQRRGLIVEITDGDTPTYRNHLFYDLAKSAVIRLAYGMAHELRPHGIAAVAVTPGFLRSEAMLDHFGVTEANWQAATSQEPHFIASETPFYIGRSIAALAADPQIMNKSGSVLSSWGLAEEYGLSDIDGQQPNWGRYRQTHLETV